MTATHPSSGARSSVQMGAVSFVGYRRQFREQRAGLMRVIEETLSAGDLVMRHQLLSFEENLADFVGARHAVGVSNCTDALRLVCHALGFGPGDEVVTVAHTFVATISPFRLAGCSPVLIDIAEDHNMDPARLTPALTERTKAVIPVHLNGRTCDMDPILDAARDIDAVVIEDAAQALGASYKGRKTGTFGRCAVYSFYPAKLLGALGDAGAVVTDDADLAAEIRLLRDHGRADKVSYARWGYNCRLDNLQAAILDYRLGLLPGWIARRREIAGRYDSALRGMADLSLPPGPDSSPDWFDVFQNYPVLTERRDELVDFLAKAGVETIISGLVPLHRQEALGLTGFDLPRTEALGRTVVSLPMYPELTDDEVGFVIDRIRECLE